MALDNPAADAPFKLAASIERTQPLTELIVEQKLHLAKDTLSRVKAAKLSTKKDKELHQKSIYDKLYERLPKDLQLACDWAREKGGSALVTTLPLAAENFHLHRQGWCDAVYMRYSWHPPGLPSVCACGQPFSVQHSQICHVSGFVDMRHENVSKVVLNALKKCLNNVGWEPVLQPVPDVIKASFKKSGNIEDGARADISADSFWNKNQTAFFDTRVFYPFAASYSAKGISAAYNHHNKEKKREYSQRINQVERGTFTPLVFSSTGSCDKETTVVLKKTAGMVAEKTGQEYSHVFSLLRVRIAFDLIHSSLRCLRGTRNYRSKSHNHQKSILDEVVNHYAGITE